MAFTVSDFEDLLALLAAHPEWRARLRPVVLGPDFEEVPSRLDRIEAILERVALRQEQTEREIALLAARFDGRMNRLDGRMGNLEGQVLELNYDRNLENWIGDFLRRPKRVALPELDQLRAAVASGVVSETERRRLRDVDLIAVGQDLANPDTELYVTCEVSYTINMEDIARADEHAGILRRCGYNARGLVGGYRAAPGVEQAAGRLGVIVDLHRPPAEQTIDSGP
jgi:hypothetical protein